MLKSTRVILFIAVIVSFGSIVVGLYELVNVYQETKTITFKDVRLLIVPLVSGGLILNLLIQDQKSKKKVS